MIIANPAARKKRFSIAFYRIAIRAFGPNANRGARIQAED